MGRKNRRAAQPVRALGLASVRWTESGRSFDWQVQRIRGNDKRYVCPGCQQQIAPGVGHIVAWPDDGIWGVDNRQHWHEPCWRRGAHRR